MPFDAGSILGHLGLDISEYGKGMLEAEAISKVFPSIVIEFLENPLLGVIEIAKESAEAIYEMGEKFVDTIKEVGEAAAQMGLAAQKAGVSVQYFSEMAAVAKNVGVPVEALANSFKFLQRSAADVVDGQGSKEMIDAFQRLGISTQFLQDNLGDAQAMFEKVKSGLDGVGTQAERTRIEMALLGRGGSELIPIFNLNKEAMAGMIQTAHDLGAVETDESVRSGAAFLQLEAQVDEAFEGMKKAASEPILDFLKDHMAEITPKIVEGSRFMREELEKFFAWLGSDDGKQFEKQIQDIGKSLENLGSEILVDLGIETPAKFDLKIKEIAADIKWAADEAKKFADALDRDFAAVKQTALQVAGQTADDPNRNKGYLERVFHIDDNEVGKGFWGHAWNDTKSVFEPGYTPGPQVASPAPAGNTQINTNVNLDPNATAAQIAGKVVPEIQKGLKQAAVAQMAGKIASQVRTGMGN